jgi:hypothetical protein
MLELRRLRQETYATWQWLQKAQTSSTSDSSPAVLGPESQRLPYTDTRFKDDIRRRYGDLRCRYTWEQAAIALTADRISQNYLEPHEIVGYLTSPEYLNCTIRKHYGERLIEILLQFPEILELLQDGLEHLYHVSNNAADREIALDFSNKIARRLFPRPQTQQAA